jgi:toxin CcdB
VSPLNQFDVVANPFPRSRERQPYLVTLQSDILARNLETVVVAPLEPAGQGPFADELNPRIEIAGTPFVLIAQELVTVRKAALGPAQASAVAERDRIIAALDLLFTGF